MKVFVQIIDSKYDTYQGGMIDEPIAKGFEIKNAIEHFGSSNVNWVSESETDEFIHKIGKIKDTTKIVSVILKKNT